MVDWEGLDVGALMSMYDIRAVKNTATVNAVIAVAPALAVAAVVVNAVVAPNQDQENVVGQDQGIVIGVRVLVHAIVVSVRDRVRNAAKNDLGHVIANGDTATAVTGIVVKVTTTNGVRLGSRTNPKMITVRMDITADKTSMTTVARQVSMLKLRPNRMKITNHLMPMGQRRGIKRFSDIHMCKLAGISNL